MTITEFCDKIDETVGVRGVRVFIGDTPSEDFVVVEDTARKEKSRLSSACITGYEWNDLLNVILGITDATPVHHVSRIVGYFSRVENWNASKLGELADRRLGNYVIPAGVSKL